jgi:hypothetical protein
MMGSRGFKGYFEQECLARNSRRIQRFPRGWTHWAKRLWWRRRRRAVKVRTRKEAAET